MMWWLHVSSHFPNATLCLDTVDPSLPELHIARHTRELIASRNPSTEDQQHIPPPIKSMLIIIKSINAACFSKLHRACIFIKWRITWRSNWREPNKVILLEFGSIRSTNTVPDVLAELAKDCPWSHIVKPTSGPPLCMYVCLFNENNSKKLIIVVNTHKL